MPSSAAHGGSAFPRDFLNKKPSENGRLMITRTFFSAASGRTRRSA
jgi:hypothetical protein